jgi:hypothetical protein
MSRILVEYSDHYNYGSAVTPHAAEVERTWVRNEVGTASITFPITTPNLMGIVQWGRIFRIHEYGVPSWAGVATEMEWTDSGVVLHLKSMEWTLQKNVTGQGLAFAPGTRAGQIAYGVFASSYYVNRTVHPIRAGVFDATKPRFVEPYNYADCWEELKKLADESGADVWVDDKLYCHFRDARGTDKSASIKLREGKHLVNVSVSTSIEDTLTAAIGLGKGDTLAQKPKVATMWNADPGYERTEVLTFDSITSPDALREPVFQAIRDRAYPKMTVDCEFVKVPSGEFWGQFFVGDTIELLLNSYQQVNWWTGQMMGLNNRARVLGVELGGEDKMRLVLELVPGNRDLHFLGWTPTNAAL